MPTHFEVPLYLDYLAVFTWALSGAILGVSKGYDLTGVFIVALLSSVGGSMLRDGIFLNQPPPVVTNPYYPPLILLVTVLVGLFLRLLVTPRLRRHTNNLVDVIDAIGTPAFAVIGMQLSLASGIPLPGVVLIGAINGVGGSVLRDILVGGGRSDIKNDRLAAIAARHDATVAQIALAWLLALAPITLAIPGTGSLVHLEENIAAGAIALIPEDLADLHGAEADQQ